MTSVDFQLSLNSASIPDLDLEKNLDPEWSANVELGKVPEDLEQ